MLVLQDSLHPFVFVEFMNFLHNLATFGLGLLEGYQQQRTTGMLCHSGIKEGKDEKSDRHLCDGVCMTMQHEIPSCVHHPCIAFQNRLYCHQNVVLFSFCQESKSVTNFKTVAQKVQETFKCLLCFFQTEVLTFLFGEKACKGL